MAASGSGSKAQGFLQRRNLSSHLRYAAPTEITPQQKKRKEKKSKTKQNKSLRAGGKLEARFRCRGRGFRAVKIRGQLCGKKALTAGAGRGGVAGEAARTSRRRSKEREAG